MKHKISALILLIFISSCSPISMVTSAPGYALMTSEMVNKKARMREYAEKGDVHHQYELAMADCCGNEPWHDDAEALKWFCVSAKKGYSKSQLELGKIYENTRDLSSPPVTPDLKKAYFWYSVADRYINYEASLAKKRLKEIIPAKDVSTIEYGLTNWRQMPCP